MIHGWHPRRGRADRVSELSGRFWRAWPSLGAEIDRATESVALNVRDARPRAGLDRADPFRHAGGSSGEFTTALHIARARGEITPVDHAAVDAALDRVRATRT